MSQENQPATNNNASNANSDSDIAVLGGGCFWCVEAVFQRHPGVTKVVSGYAGGASANPTYRQICQGDSGHAEVIKVVFSPTQTSFAELLELFWRAHDPTTLNRQGADSGSQYRSIILHNSDEQRTVAEQSLQAVQKHFANPIVTEISALSDFWDAEPEHQDFFNRNGQQPYCLFNIIPKLQKLKLPA